MADEWKYGNRVDGDEVSFNDTSYVVRIDTDQTVYDAVGSTTSDQDYTNVLSRLKALENANNTGVNGYGTIEFWTREQQDDGFITTSASTTIPKTRDKRALNVLFHSHINPYGLFPLDLKTRLGITLEPVSEAEIEGEVAA